MCGILFWLRGDSSRSMCVEKGLRELRARGPEGSRILDVSGATFGFTRLAINGLNESGMQPFHAGDASGSLVWMCNGEIYNMHNLETRLGYESMSGSDCEVLGTLWKACDGDLVAFARALDGVFSLALYDESRREYIVARDPYGVRPLYYAWSNGWMFASERKALVPFVQEHGGFIEEFPVGEIWRLHHPLGHPEKVVYHTVPWLKEAEQPLSALVQALDVAVEKRLLTERPVAALLSGGIDSSLIAALVQKKLKALGKPALKTFSIGMAGGTDLAYARKVADWIGSEHTEVIVTADEMFAAIPDVIRDIESYDITTVRASVGNWMVAREIRKQTECKVVFNGDGSDEIFGSYKYFVRAPNDYQFEAETQRLLREIHQYDVLRSDRSISSHGLEARTPFLDKQFVGVAMSYATELRRPFKGTDKEPFKGRIEKWLLREAFKDTGLLPPEVLWRRKEAFSDGVSSEEKSWYEIIQDKIQERGLVSKEEVEGWKGDGPRPRTAEAVWYRRLYDQMYPCTATYWPYWMPRWSPETSDPSARTLVLES
jgi:asparagine synthase (glutamine-hydrolysing)